METRTPYRIVVFARGILKNKKKPCDYAYDAWHETQYYREARLPHAGSFLFPGLHAVRRAAMDILALPEVHQISIRTNQDRQVYVFNKQSDDRILGYNPA